MEDRSRPDLLSFRSSEVHRFQALWNPRRQDDDHQGATGHQPWRRLILQAQHPHQNRHPVHLFSYLHETDLQVLLAQIR